MVLEDVVLVERVAVDDDVAPPGGALDSLARWSWGADVDAGTATAVVLVWTGVAVWIAQRSMRWEPRR